MMELVFKGSWMSQRGLEYAGQISKQLVVGLRGLNGKGCSDRGLCVE